MGKAMQHPCSASLQTSLAFVGSLGYQLHQQLICRNNHMQVKWNCIHLRWKRVHLHSFSLALECERADTHAAPTHRSADTRWLAETKQRSPSFLPSLPLPPSLIILVVPLNHLRSSSFSSPLLKERGKIWHLTMDLFILRINHEHKPVLALFISLLL